MADHSQTRNISKHYYTMLKRLFSYGMNKIIVNFWRSFEEMGECLNNGFKMTSSLRDLELEVSEDDIQELIMYENDLKNSKNSWMKNTKKLSEMCFLLKKKETKEKRQMPVSAIKDLLKKWENV
ncbi:hypothetical protein K0M31_012551 [Melipona bicolor]|uniref:Uncharacterized protein n=1 Tax=Melipona bicolor TaxID=60889 RepID=A0AA40FJW5_9HYME|nr:hypothetical protein K0M31_012551 [Melipona bicolor]